MDQPKEVLIARLKSAWGHPKETMHSLIPPHHTGWQIPVPDPHFCGTQCPIHSILLSVVPWGAHSEKIVIVEMKIGRLCSTDYTD